MRKTIWKKALNLLRHFFLVIFSLVLTYTVCALLLSCFSTTPEPHSCHQKNNIFIQSNGIHLTIIIPKHQLKGSFLKELFNTSSSRFFSFGWGDRDFYIETPEWSDLKLITAFKALFLKTEGAMHVTMYEGLNNNWHAVPVCSDQLDLLLEFIESSFKKSEEGFLIKIPDAGYSDHDDFYEAGGNYTLLYTSNNWVNEALKAADVKTAVWSPFDKGVLYHLKKSTR